MTYEPNYNDRVRVERKLSANTTVVYEFNVTYIADDWFGNEDITVDPGNGANTVTLLERGFIDEPHNLGAFVHVTYNDGRIFTCVRTSNPVNPWFPVDLRLPDGRNITPDPSYYTWNTFKKDAKDIKKGLAPRG
jgi:hypothetical protein